MDIDLKVAQLLVSRVCHDLAGGVSAVNAGVELIKDGGGAIDPEALSLIDGSAKQTVSRLSFFRVVFGAGGGSEYTIAITELETLSNSYLEGGRIELCWPGRDAMAQTQAQTDGLVPLNAGKVLLALILLSTDALPRGGKIQVGISPLNNAIGFALGVHGENAGLSAELEAAMSAAADPASLSARTVHAYFAATLVEQLKGEIEYSRDPTGEVHLAAVVPLSA